MFNFFFHHLLAGLTNRPLFRDSRAGTPLDLGLKIHHSTVVPPKYLNLPFIIFGTSNHSFNHPMTLPSDPPLNLEHLNITEHS